MLEPQHHDLVLDPRDQTMVDDPSLVRPDSGRAIELALEAAKKVCHPSYRTTPFEMK